MDGFTANFMLPPSRANTPDNKQERRRKINGVQNNQGGAVERNIRSRASPLWLRPLFLHLLSLSIR